MAVIELDKSQFDEKINAKGVVLVDFFADWCGPCKRLKPVLEEVSAENIVVYSVDVDSNKDLAERFQVSSLPTVLIFKDGTKVDQFIGVHEKEDIISLVEKHS